MIGLVFEESTYGRARMELYQNEEKVRSGSPSRTILLTDCVSMRAHSQAGRISSFLLVLPLIFQDNEKPYEYYWKTTVHWKYSPRITIFYWKPCAKLLSRRNMSPCRVPYWIPLHLQRRRTSYWVSSLENSVIYSYSSGDQYPVLLLPSPLTKTKQLSEGSYHLHFGDSLSLITGELQVLSFNYCDLLW